MENNEKNLIKIDIVFLLNKLWNKKLIILLTTFVFTALALAYSLFVAVPKYDSTTKVYVVNQNKDNKAVTAQDIQLGNFLVKDYREIILSEKVMSEVIADSNLNMTVKELTKKVTVDAPKDTRILSIKVTDKDANVASNLANKVREKSAEQIKEVTRIEDVTTLEEAKPATTASSPNILKNGVLAAGAGLFLAIICVVLAELLDDRVRRPEDIEETMGMVLLGMVPKETK